jgi:hypothetical protein
MTGYTALAAFYVIREFSKRAVVTLFGVLLSQAT